MMTDPPTKQRERPDAYLCSRAGRATVRTVCLSTNRSHASGAAGAALTAGQVVHHTRSDNQPTPGRGRRSVVLGHWKGDILIGLKRSAIDNLAGLP